MSVEAITWALSQKMDRSSAKFVLVALANCCGAEMTCWPSSQYLCDATCQDRKTVLDNLRRLRDAGFISDTGERKGATGSVVVYRLSGSENGIAIDSEAVPKTELLSSPENGTSPENGIAKAVPKTDMKQSRKRTGSSPENGTRNRKGTVKEPIPPLIPPAGGKKSLPQDWQPSEQVLAWAAREFGLRVPEDVERYVGCFRDYCASSGKRYADFDAAFRNVVRQDWPRLRSGKKRMISADPVLTKIRERYPDTVPDGRGYYDPGTRCRFDSRGEMVVV